MTSALREIGLDVLNLLFPGRCFRCKTVLERGTCICSACLAAAAPIEGRTCVRCGAPAAGESLTAYGGLVEGEASASGNGVNIASGEASRDCPQCADLRLLFGRNESFGVYEGTLRELIHLYKFEKRRSLHRLFTELLLDSKRRFISGHDLVVPVPLTRERVLDRGYNQSFLVARGLAARLPVAFLGEALVRRGNSRPQSGIRTRGERLANVTDRISVGRNAVRAVRGSSVLLVDDVLTTGATASLCAKALLCEGARSVDLLTVARALIDPVDV
jgi:ComF family protein